MTEHNNPLMRANPGQMRGRVTLASLEAYCVELNSKNFVVASGKPYFVRRVVKDTGEVEHQLDRTI